MAEVKEYTDTEYAAEMKNKVARLRLARPSFQYGTDTIGGEMRHTLQLPYWIHVVLNRGDNLNWVFKDNAGVEKFAKMYPEFTFDGYGGKAAEWRLKNMTRFNTLKKAQRYLGDTWKKLQVKAK